MKYFFILLVLAFCVINGCTKNQEQLSPVMPDGTVLRSTDGGNHGEPRNAVACCDCSFNSAGIYSGHCGNSDMTCQDYCSRKGQIEHVFDMLSFAR